jgi:hypothetical protein
MDPNGWLREYLHGIRDDLQAVQRQLDRVEARLTALETTRAVHARTWQRLRAWGSVLLAALSVGWSIAWTLWHAG